MGESTEVKGKAVSSALWKFLDAAGRQGIQLLVQIVMARILAPGDFGMLAIIIVFANIGRVFVLSGLNSALVQSKDADSDDFSTVFWISFAIAAVLYLIVFLAAPLIAAFYEMPDLLWPLRVLMLLLFINAYNAVQVAEVTRNLELKKTFSATIFSVIVSGAIGIALALLGMGIWALVVQQLVYQGVNCLVLATKVSWRPKLVFKGKKAKELFSFGWKILATGLLACIYDSFSDLIIGKQFTASDLGLVSQGKKYPSALGNIFDTATRQVVMSATARLQDSTADVKRLARRSLKISSLAVVPVMMFFAVAAMPIIDLVFGDKWLGCVPYLQLYCIAYALLPIQTSNIQVINGLGRSDIYLKIEILKRTYGILVLSFAAFVLKDIFAIVVGYLICTIVDNVVNSLPSKKLIGYSIIDQAKDFFPIVISSLAAGACAMAVSLLVSGALVSFLVQGLVFFGVLLAIFVVFKVEAFEYVAGMAKEFLRSRASR